MVLKMVLYLVGVRLVVVHEAGIRGLDLVSVVFEGDVELARFRAGVHLVEGVLQHAHLPDVLGRVRLVEHELHAELVVLTLDSKVAPGGKNGQKCYSQNRLMGNCRIG